MEKLLEHFGYTAPFIYAAAAYGLFAWLDANASDEAKCALSMTMKVRQLSTVRVASALVEVFDRIYTRPLWGWRAMLRSALFTVLITVAFLFETGLTDVLSFRYLAGNIDDILAWSLLLNAMTDYLSLFLIRSLLMRSGSRPVLWLTVGSLAGASTIVLANGVRALAVLVAMAYRASHSPLELMDFGLFRAMFEGFGLLALPAILVFGWLPLFALGIVIIRLLDPLSWVVDKTQWFLKDGKDRPLKAIGYVAAVVVFLGTVAGRVAFGAWSLAL
jgi:hypothetical protein